MVNGYYITAGNKGYFMRTESKIKTKTIIQSIIQQIGIQRGLCDGWINRCMNDPETMTKIREEAAPASVEKNTAADGTIYYTIYAKGMTSNWAANDFMANIIVFA